MGIPADLSRHWTFTHHDYKRANPRLQEYIVECIACLWTDNGYTRREEARKSGRRHEGEANHD